MEKESKLFAYLGAISAIITVGDFLFKTIVNQKAVFSPITIWGIIGTAVFASIYFVMKDPHINYNIKKILSFYCRRKDSYYVENKECIYIFKSRTEMEYTKKHLIVSNVNDLKHFYDKFKWSKEQKSEDIDIISNIDGHKVNVKRSENWHQYVIEFDEIGKGQKQPVSITIRNLSDPNKESLPFLSSNIVCRTKNLRLVVCFKDSSLKPIKIKYKIYDNYASDFPIYQKDLAYDLDEQKIEINEKLPIYGYRYQIYWEFG